MIDRLRSSNAGEQATAAEQLGEFAHPLTEAALLDCFAGNTYQLIDQDGSPGRYYDILSSAAKSLARLNTDRAFHALVTKIRSNPRNDQLGVAAAVYGISFSPRPEVENVIRSVTPDLHADSGTFLAKQIDESLVRIKSRVEDATPTEHAPPIVWPWYVRWLAVAYVLSRLVGPCGFVVMMGVAAYLIVREGPKWDGPPGVAVAGAWACLLVCAAFRMWFVNWGSPPLARKCVNGLAIAPHPNEF